jgi:hypothetical protein
MGGGHGMGYSQPMFTALLTVFVALSISGLVMLLVAARRAPVGFEDEAGFHAIESRSRHEAVLGAAIRAH